MIEMTTTQRWFMLLLVILTAAVLALGYAVFQLNQRLQQLAPSVTEHPGSTASSSSSKSDKDLSPRIAQPRAPAFSTPEPPSFLDPGVWDPFQELKEMQQRVDELFNNAFERFESSPKFGNLVTDLGFNPRMDMTEDEKQYVVRLDIPGADAANLQIRLENNTLTITGTREKDEEEQSGQRALRRERRIGQFQRVITFPTPVKQGSLKSDYKDGVLTVTIEKEKSAY